MKITIITLDNWGFNQHIANELKIMGHTVHHIDFSELVYEYSNFGDRVCNFLSKTLINHNKKKEVLHNRILYQLKKLGRQDLIFMVKADFLMPKTIKSIRFYAIEFICFFNDNYLRAKNIERIHKYFDKVYSFEKEDVENFGFHFAPNFIYDETPLKIKSNPYAVFNVSSYDLSRSKVIERVAHELDSLNLDYKIINVGKNAKKYEFKTDIEFTNKKISLIELKNILSNSIAMLDVHRNNQNGLTFRCFESLGYKKKLITTNSDIKTYDFYNPNNILIIDKANIKIPREFFNKPYIDVPENIYQKYRLKPWIEKVIGVKSLVG